MSENFEVRNSESNMTETPRVETMEMMQGDITNALRTEMGTLHNEKEFHNSEHPEGVLRASENILSLIESVEGDGVITEEMKKANELAALAHDLVLKTIKNDEPNKVGYGTIIRARGWAEDGSDLPPAFVGNNEVVVGNERASYNKLVELLDEKDPNREYYSDEMIQIAHDSIAATYPEIQIEELQPDQMNIEVDGVVYDVSDTITTLRNGGKLGLKFDQPYLNEESGLNTIALAMGDIMTVGRVSSEEFIEEGDAEFRELNYRIKELVTQGLDTLSSEDKVSTASLCLSWLRNQTSFGIMQKERFNEILESNIELNNLAHVDSVKDGLSKEYAHFDRNIIAVAERARIAIERYGQLEEGKAFTSYEDNELLSELLSEMGY